MQEAELRRVGEEGRKDRCLDHLLIHPMWQDCRLLHLVSPSRLLAVGDHRGFRLLLCRH